MKQIFFREFNLFILKSVDSTNCWLHERRKQKQSISNQVVCADYQSAGRGTGPNQWHSKPSQNLLFSIGMDASFISAARQFLITQIIALAVTDVMADYVDSEKLRVKWPNDIFYEDKKLGGILIANTLSANRLDSSVIGVGININQTVFPEWIPRPVSLRLISDRKFDTFGILKSILTRFSFRWNQAKTAAGVAGIEEAYHQKMFRLGQWHIFSLNNCPVELRIKGIGEYGMLLLENRAGETLSYDFKSVRFLFEDE